MVSKYDLLYSVFLNEGLTAAQLVRKIGKTPYDYDTVLKHLLQLREEKLVETKKNKYYLSQKEETKKLLRIIDYCFRNKINYNELFLDKTIEFIKFGLENKDFSELGLNNRTRARISLFLSKHGFIIIESKKPFKVKMVYSDFLKKTVEIFKGEIKVKCDKIYEQMDGEEIDSQIEKEFSKYKKAAKQINLNDEVRFVHRSLSLEGNTMTLSETEKLIKQNIPPKERTFQEMQETVDYKKALDYLIEIKELDFETTLKFHGTAMNSLKAGAGEFRKQNIRIKGNPDFKTADWRQIPNRLEDLFKYYQNKIHKKIKAHESVELSAYLHSEFQHIHPFIDGNSRTSRAIFIHVLLLKGFPLINFPAGFVEQYMELTKLSKKRDDKKFTVFMKQLVLHSLKQTNQKIRYL
ncbi:MAG: Fic family protein [Candidatus Diapherotrites archaeon]